MKFSDNGISQDVIDIAARIMRGEKIEEKKKLDPVDKEELKGKHHERDDADIDNDGDSDESDEYLHKKRKAISKSMKEDQKPIKLKGFGKDKAGLADIKNPIARASLMRKDKAKKEEVEVEEGFSSADRPGQQPKKIKRPKQGDYKNYVDLRPSKLNAPGGRDKVKYVGEESPDMDSDNAQKAVKHDCATHVVHKEHGEGRCVPGMHTLEENEDGTGYVTHYDVMFSGEEGPYILEDCPVEDLDIVKEMHHGHKKKK